MKRKMAKKLLALTSAAAIAVTMLAGCGSDASSETSGSAGAEGGISIGLISPNTGNLAAYGEAALNGANLAIEEINAAGGINGETVSLVSYDDKGDSTEGTNAFNKLSGEDVCAVIGSITSGVTTSLAPLADESGLVLLTPTATADTVTEEDDYVFRVCFKDSFQGTMAAKFAAEEGVTKVAVLYASGDAYSAGVRESFVAACADFGLEIVAEESSSSTDDTEFSSQLTNIAASDAELLFAPYYYNAAAPYIIPQARAAGFDGIIVGADGYDGLSDYMLDDLSVYHDVFYTNHYSAEDTSDVVQTFVTAYNEAYNGSPTTISALTYDGVYMLKQAIETAGSTDRSAIRDAMSGMSFSGVTGSFTLDETGTPEKSVTIIEYVDGQPTFYKVLDAE